MEEQVRTKMTEAFHLFKDKDGIQMKNIRVKIMKSGSSLNLMLMNKTEDVRPTNLDEVIGSMAMLMYGTKIRNTFYNSVSRIINENGLNEKSANIRVYPSDNGSPLVHLFVGNKSLKSLNINELIN